jgi:hypothetical protein
MLHALIHTSGCVSACRSSTSLLPSSQHAQRAHNARPGRASGFRHPAASRAPHTKHPYHQQHDSFSHPAFAPPFHPFYGGDATSAGTAWQGQQQGGEEDLSAGLWSFEGEGPFTVGELRRMFNRCVCSGLWVGGWVGVGG